MFQTDDVKADLSDPNQDVLRDVSDEHRYT